MRKGILVLVFAVTAAPALGLGRSPDPIPAAREVRSSLELIAVALTRGELDEDTAVLYRVYTVVAEDQLPERFRGGGGGPRDGTPILQEARGRYENLRPEIQDALKPYLFPRGSR